MYEDQNGQGQGGFDPNAANGQSDRYGQYEYSFQTGSAYGGGPSGDPQKTGKSGQSHFLRSFLTVVLCVAMSFCAGVGGAYYAYRNLTKQNGTTNVNPAPSNDSLYSKDPANLLNRTEAEYSPFGSAGEDAYAISDVIRMVENSVVVIQATVPTTGSWGTTTTGVSSGSGVIISAEGYILTCHHVVDGARSVSVKLNTGGVYEASLVGSDEKSDLAVLKIAPNENEPLTAAKHGKSGYLVKGEHVVAIGNPLGTLGGTVTDGIISATERQVSTDNGVMTLLQTNAAINSGNSGGGLFNLKGELIGIVNAKYAASGVEGLAFAIPIDLAYEVELQLIEFGYRRGIVDHGLTFVEINAENIQYYRYKYSIQEKGLYVVSSNLNTELKNKDRIVSVNGTAISTEAEFEALIDSCQVGDVLTIEYERSSQKYQTTLTLEEYVPDSMKISN